MKIRTLLSLSHAIVIGIFILTFLSIFFTLTKPPGPPPGMRMSGRLSGILKTCKTPEELAKATRTIGHGNLSALDIYDAQGRRKRLLGPDVELATPSFVEAIRKEGLYYREEPQRGGVHVNWCPVSLDGPNSHIARMEFVRKRDEFFDKVRRNILLACGVAFMAVLFIALTLSRALAKPIRSLASLVDRYGREGYSLRSEIKGTEELAELSHSFNRMAEFIEDNTNKLRERTEEAERAEALRRQFLSDVSHNLRTPLAAIMGWNDALIDGVAEDESLYRSRIRREVVHVTKTVQRLLELSRWERSAPVLLKEDIPLSDLLLEVAETLQEAAEQADITLSFEGLSPNLTIHADRQKARDIFQILLENVVEHAGKGVHAEVSVEARSETILISVKDTGCGLPSTFQGETDIERGASEVGRACLGLAIASRLVKVHGGDLKLSNHEGGGVEATFDLPRGGDQR